MSGYYSDDYDYGYGYGYEDEPVHCVHGSSTTIVSTPPPQAMIRHRQGGYNSKNNNSSSSSYQQTTKWNQHDNQTGSYAKATVRQEASSGQVFKERGSGRVGYKDEVKHTTTFRVGNKNGYTEYQVEERIRNVNYGGGSNKSLKYNKKY